MAKAWRVVLAGGLLTAATAAWAQAPAVSIETKAAQCIGCHGIAGYRATFPEVHRVPMIGGQSEAYLVAALQAYRKGLRKHPTMRAVAQNLADADIAALAAFYARQGAGAPAPAQAQPAAPAAVAELLTRGACASCHGASFSQPIDPTYPRLAGQYADYLLAALRAYRTEGHALIGRANPIMAAQARPYTPGELQAIVEYLAALPGELHPVPQRGLVSAAANAAAAAR